VSLLVVNSDLFLSVSHQPACHVVKHYTPTFSAPLDPHFHPQEKNTIKIQNSKILLIFCSKNTRNTLLSESGVAAFASFVKLDKSEAKVVVTSGT